MKVLCVGLIYSLLQTQTYFRRSFLSLFGGEYRPPEIRLLSQAKTWLGVMSYGVWSPLAKTARSQTEFAQCWEHEDVTRYPRNWQICLDHMNDMTQHLSQVSLLSPSPLAPEKGKKREPGHTEHHLRLERCTWGVFVFACPSAKREMQPQHHVHLRCQKLRFAKGPNHQHYELYLYLINWSLLGSKRLQLVCPVWFLGSKSSLKILKSKKRVFSLILETSQNFASKDVLFRFNV